ncbi:hypothetical protein SAMN05216526_1339 [Ectothiorhodosinus mongolicus]|uniref:Cytochrome c domain-containing protein n=1 Tax=Ectothiorhodosinus mongolicus TaxID=233100 RepID=A0A1R3W224_9GAMM|nr:cytochrome c-552 like protein [Ectothiorhodosinus mongolicus]SIT70544.1 hypothetical protein SAMN05216526_1339 [Ectothiorhodosinus mongolicus]
MQVRGWTKFRSWALATAIVSVGLVSPVTLHAQGSAADGITPEVLFTATCGACHTLDKATGQRLNRADWEWVMDDMESYGMIWLTPVQRESIVDYLVDNYGRNVPR